jgi:hypothetical protein
MQNSPAYIEFIKQINAVGREKMDGYDAQTLENIYDWERELVEDIIWNKFVEGKDSDLAIFMPKLTRYDGIGALKSNLDKCIVPSGASFNISETLYIVTNEKEYLRLLIKNYKETSDKAARIEYVSRLSRLAKKQEVYNELIEIYIDDRERANQSSAIKGILWADGYLRNVDDMDEIIGKMELLRLFNKEGIEDRKAAIADYRNGKLERYRI